MTDSPERSPELGSTPQTQLKRSHAEDYAQMVVSAVDWNSLSAGQLFYIVKHAFNAGGNKALDRFKEVASERGLL